MRTTDPWNEAEEQRTFRFLRREWTIAEIVTLGLFVLIGGLMTLGPSELTMGYMYLAIISVFAYGFGVRWAIVKMLPISLIAALAWPLMATLYREFTNRPKLIDSEAIRWLALSSMIAVPPIVVLPFAQPFRTALLRIYTAVAGSKVGQGLKTLWELTYIVISGVFNLFGILFEGVAGCLMSVVVLIFLVWLVKTIWYAV